MWTDGNLNKWAPETYANINGQEHIYNFTLQIVFI